MARYPGGGSSGSSYASRSTTLLTLPVALPATRATVFEHARRLRRATLPAAASAGDVDTARAAGPFPPARPALLVVLLLDPLPASAIAGGTPLTTELASGYRQHRERHEGQHRASALVSQQLHGEPPFVWGRPACRQVDQMAPHAGLEVEDQRPGAAVDTWSRWCVQVFHPRVLEILGPGPLQRAIGPASYRPPRVRAHQRATGQRPASARTDPPPPPPPPPQDPASWP